MAIQWRKSDAHRVIGTGPQGDEYNLRQRQADGGSYWSAAWHPEENIRVGTLFTFTICEACGDLRDAKAAAEEKDAKVRQRRDSGAVWVDDKSSWVYKVGSRPVSTSGLDLGGAAFGLAAATVTPWGGKPKSVQNLGWLLRNWQKVHSFRFLFIRPKKDNWNDGELIAMLRGTGPQWDQPVGGVYRTDFASYGIARDFLDRPVFRGLPLTTVLPDTSRHDETIGSPEYRARSKKQGGQLHAEAEEVKAGRRPPGGYVPRFDGARR